MVFEGWVGQALLVAGEALETVEDLLLCVLLALAGLLTSCLKSVLKNKGTISLEKGLVVIQHCAR
jgi:hypothetical protein